MSQSKESQGDKGLLLSTGQLHSGESGWPRGETMYAGPTETALLLLWVWPSQGRGSGPWEGIFLCPLAPQCSCLLMPANTKCLWGGGQVTEDGFPVRASFRFHHIHLLASEALVK